MPRRGLNRLTLKHGEKWPIFRRIVAIPFIHLTPQDRLELDALAGEFGSDPRQKAKAEACAKRRGMPFVREQAAIVRANPKIENLAGAFEKACGSPEGWKRPKPAVPKKSRRKQDPEPKLEEPPQPPPDYSAELAW